MGALSLVPRERQAAGNQSDFELARRFPDSFLFGAATSSYQIEGAADEDGREESIWDAFARTPGKTFRGQNGSVACDHYHRYRDDVAIMAELGLDAYRLSTAWPRIIPDGHGAVNERGLDFYDRLIDELLARQIVPFITLYHWDLPQSIEFNGGWLSAATVDAFGLYVEAVVRRLSDRVTNWITLNEPHVQAWSGYAHGEHAPGRQDGAKGAVQAAHNMLLAHGSATAIIRSLSTRAKVGITLDLAPVHRTDQAAETAEAARVADGRRNRWFLDPVFRGRYPDDMTELLRFLPEGRTADLDRVRTPIDFLGVNYYQPLVVGTEGASASGRHASESPPTDIGWAICPDGLRELLERLWSEYHPDGLYVTENGAAYSDSPATDGSVADTRRASYIRHHLGAVADAIEYGVPVNGYFVWSLLDNYEWARGYHDDARFGIVYVDYETQRRYIKDSAKWFAGLIEAHRAVAPTPAPPRLEERRSATDPDRLAQRFPPEFVFGTATSGYQIEGALQEDGRGESIWDRFSTRPGAIADGTNATRACDHYHRWDEDLRLMSELGVRAYRFSTSWPRIIPDGTGRVNEKGVAFYERLVERMLALGIEPWLTLFHWDLPQALQDQGGWYSRSTAEAFGQYAETLARRLGDRVTHWITHNEPWCSSWLGHGIGIHAPGKVDGARGAVHAGHNILLSHEKGVAAVRAVAPNARVGIALDFYPAHPETDSVKDRSAASRFDGMRNRWFLEPLVLGVYPQLWPEQTSWLPVGYENDLQRIRGTLDFLGVNYYQRQVVRAEPGTGEPVEVSAPMSAYMDNGREIFPNGLREVLERLHREYGIRQLVITENGAAYADGPNPQGKIEDSRRIAYLRSHLSSVAHALEGGVPVTGYFVWSLLDNFEWAEGYLDNYRYGLVHVDFESEQRTPKESAAWYASLIAAHRERSTGA